MADPKYCARVYLTEARNRRGAGNFYWVLLGWAANARRRAIQVAMPIVPAPAPVKVKASRQLDLFGGVA